MKETPRRRITNTSSLNEKPTDQLENTELEFGNNLWGLGKIKKSGSVLASAFYKDKRRKINNRKRLKLS